MALHLVLLLLSSSSLGLSLTLTPFKPVSVRIRAGRSIQLISAPPDDMGNRTDFWIFESHTQKRPLR